MGDLRSYIPKGVDILPFKAKEKYKKVQIAPKHVRSKTNVRDANRNYTLMPENDLSLLSGVHMLPNIEVGKYLGHLT